MNTPILGGVGGTPEHPVILVGSMKALDQNAGVLHLVVTWECLVGISQTCANHELFGGPILPGFEDGKLTVNRFRYMPTHARHVGLQFELVDRART